MNNLEKTKQVLSVFVLAASAIVKLSELWEKVGPEVKKCVKPVIDGCKKIADIDVEPELKSIESK